MKQVAIVGSGCSGIGALWSLRRRSCHLDLYEQSDRVGGHANTVVVSNGTESRPVDTGFISFNRVTYPNLTRLVETLNIPLHETDMSIGVSRDSGAFEWAGVGWRGLFAQPINCLSPAFRTMIFDIIRFNYFALDALYYDDPGSDSESLVEYLDRNGYSKAFRDNYLIPIVASTWCTGPELFASSCPARMLIRFMWNHHLLENATNAIPWFTFPGGSRQYIDAVMDLCPPDNLFLNCPVRAVRNTDGGKVSIVAQDGTERLYDHVIMTCNAPQALRILGDGVTEEERQILSSFQTTQNECILHSDLSLMPRRKAAWASWNHLSTSDSIQEKHLDGKSSVTFDMNRLQGIPHDRFGHILVSMNPLHPPEPSTVRAVFNYEHPLYSVDAVQAQRRLHLIQGKRGISYAGAWTRYGFHEDGLSSGIAVAQRFCGGEGVPMQSVDVAYSRGMQPQYSWGDYAARFLLAMIRSVFLLIDPKWLSQG